MKKSVIVAITITVAITFAVGLLLMNNGDKQVSNASAVHTKSEVGFKSKDLRQKVPRKKEDLDINQTINESESYHYIASALDKNNNLIKLNNIVFLNNEKKYSKLFDDEKMNIFIENKLLTSLHENEKKKIINSIKNKYPVGTIIVKKNGKNEIVIILTSYIKSPQKDTISNKKFSSFEKNNNNLIEVYKDKEQDLVIYQEKLYKIDKDKVNLIEKYIQKKGIVGHIKISQKNNKLYIEEVSEGGNPLSKDTLPSNSKLSYNQNDDIQIFHFKYNKVEIIEKNKVKKFEEFIHWLQEKIGVQKIIVIGHTDSIGSIEYNLALSYQRAKSLDFILKKYKIAVVHIGKGESEPVASNETEDGRAKNRRVEIIPEIK